MINQTIYYPFIIFFIIVSGTIIPTALADYHEIIINPILNAGKIDVCGDLEIDCYTPNPVTINLGNKIIFSNTDTEPHFFTSGKISDNEIGIIFDSGLLAQNKTFTWSPEIVGKFSYFCPIHPWMEGVINVVQEITDHEQEEIPKVLIPEVEKVNPNLIELDEKIIPDAVEIDPEPELVDEKTITEMKGCSPSTWECMLELLYLEFSNYLNSLIQSFI